MVPREQRFALRRDEREERGGRGEGVLGGGAEDLYECGEGAV